MSNVLVEKNKLDLLANAIAGKSGEPLTLTLEEMVEAVDGIETGGGGVMPTGNIDITQWGVTDVTNYATATVPKGYTVGQMILQSTPTISVDSATGEIIAGHSSEDYIDPITDSGWINMGIPIQFITYGDKYYQLPTQSATAITPTESSQTAVAAGKYTTGAVIIDAIPATYVGSGITRRSSSDLTASGATVTVPSGYYQNQASKAIANGTAGTPTATKGAVSNHAVSVTPSVTNTTGYITGSTKTGTAVTVSASELVSGSETKTANGTYDVTNLAQLVVNVSGGSSDIATGTLTVASNVNTSTSTQITTTTTIGFTPTKFFFYRSDRSATSNHVNQASFVTLGTSYYVRTMTRYSSNALSTSGNTNNWTTQTAGYLYFNSNTIYFRSSSSYILPAGTWHWVAVK